MHAEQFVSDILIKKLGVKALTVGDDFRFGKQRQGNFSLLATMGTQVGMSVKSTASFRQLNARVSSTLIREALAEGDLVSAKVMLGHNYAISGRVIHGWKKAANWVLERQILR